MRNKIKKSIAAISTAVLLAMNGAPAYAAINCTVTGNGSNSTSTCTFITSDTKTVNQTNNATVANNASVVASTGSNSASDNTGGTTKVQTGDSKVTVSQDTTANTNTAVLTSPTSGQDHALTIENNGTGSTNTADVEKTTSVSADQSNTANVTNTSSVTADTGSNTADDNTNGSVTVTTGDADVGSTVTVTNALNDNYVSVSPNAGTGEVMIGINGNGSDSANTTDLITLNDLTFDQTNNATVDNNVAVTAATGSNSASDNTNGVVTVDTGDAWVDVSVDTSANFNTAEASLGIVGTIDLTMDGNGTTSNNTIDLQMTDAQSPTQENTASVDNTGLSFTSDTGSNIGDDNTTGTTTVMTGGTDTMATVTTDGNYNLYSN